MQGTNPSPMIIRKGGHVQALERLPKAHAEFDENYLQDLLVKHPELLPVHKLRDDVGNLLCVGREVTASGSGTIDNLYLSTGGYPVIVETKLWRNPQARREVLSQVLDYVKELADKDFEWFQKRWAEFSKKRNERQEDLFSQLVQCSDDEIDEQHFVDRLHRSLERGDILALIVGDGIESRLQQLVSHLCKDSAHLRYSLGLIELACYRLNGKTEDSELLVVPRIVQEVMPTERAYVRVEVAPELAGVVKVKSVAKDELKDPNKRYVRRLLTEDDFLNELDQSVGVQVRERIEQFYRELVDELDLEVDVKSVSLTLKVPDPLEEMLGVSVLGIEKGGRMYNTQHIRAQLRRWEIPEEAAQGVYREYWRRLNQVDQGFLEDGIGHMSTTKFVPITGLIEKLDAIAEEIRWVVGRIRQVREK